VFEIGGPDVLSYAEMMATYAESVGLPKRRQLPVPVTAPRLSSLWVGLVTPVPAQIARPLVDSLLNPVVVDDRRAEELFPFERVPLAEAIRLALRRVTTGDVPTKFDDASSPVWQASSIDPSWTGGTERRDVRTVATTAGPHEAWRAVCRIGGERGWYHGDRLWKLRGLADRVVGGPGLRRGRRNGEQLAVGEPLDWWRVEDLETDRCLALRAEMRVPGEAWLEWRVEPTAGGSRIVQTARFRPRGLFGRLYWYGMLPFHWSVFPGLLAGIVRDAESLSPPG
jgi:hypothetical protein